MKKNKLTLKFMSLTIIIIVGIMCINLFWNYQVQKKQAINEMTEKSRILTRQLDATWQFMSINQNKINYDSKGNFEFKHLNCSTVGMGIAALFSRNSEYKIKETKSDPRNMLNTPDEFELKVLNQFKENPDITEYWSMETLNNKQVFRYMKPLKVEDSCLECHGDPVGEIDISGFPKEGWKIGELGGAISIIMPTETFEENMKTNFISNAIFLLAIIISCIISIYFLVTRLVINSLGRLEKVVSQVGSGNLDVDLNDLGAEGEIKELATHFQNMVIQLKDLYSNMELKVEQRTLELGKANQILKLKQQELEEVNVKLSEANKYKSEFLAIMSHELRTPLTSVLAFVEILLMELPSENEIERHYIEEIKVNSEILLRLINNILDLAKIEAGKGEITFEIMDMTDVIASVEGVIIPLAKNKGIDLIVRISPEVPLIKADPEKIRRVVENLAGNAVKFTDKGGKVEIHVDLDRQRNEVLILVSDTGIGIKDDDREHIFEKFTQADSSITRKHRGTGLGLALAKELVELHGGWIKVDSIPEVGSTFTVGIPIGNID